MTSNLHDFQAVFPKIRDRLVALSKSEDAPSNVVDWYQKVLDHNTRGGKLNRGMSVIDTARILLGRPLKNEEFHHTAVLGWLVELLQAFFLVADDMMDASLTRRGAPCWYLMPGVGNIAINDAFMIEAAIYQILREEFRTHPSYLDMLELFHDVTFKTELGQSSDLLMTPDGKVDLARFSLDRFMFTVRYKTAFYSFYLPVALALHYTRLSTPHNLEQAQKILIPMGEYFQVQDDYLDAFADAKVIGKIGTDIQDNKCSWLINQALIHASTEQRALLDANYGVKDAQKEQIVRQVYKDIGLQSIYEQYEEKTVAKLRLLFHSLDEQDGLKKEVFDEFLNKIYHRCK